MQAKNTTIWGASVNTISYPLECRMVNMLFTTKKMWEWKPIKEAWDTKRSPPSKWQFTQMWIIQNVALYPSSTSIMPEFQQNAKQMHCICVPKWIRRVSRMDFSTVMCLWAYINSKLQSKKCVLKLDFRGITVTTVSILSLQLACTKLGLMNKQFVK